MRLGLGALTFAKRGLDLQIQYRLPGSHVALGLRYAKWDDTTNSPLTGEVLSETTESLAGATAYWIFGPPDASTWFAGVELLRATRLLTTVADGSEDKQSVIAPMIGGGWMGRLGPLHLQAGLFFSLGKRLKTQTPDSSEENVVFDPQIQVGLCF